MTIEELQTAANTNETLTRADVQEALTLYDNPDSKYVNMQTFLEGITCLTEDEKLMVLNDLDSYV